MSHKDDVLQEIVLLARNHGITPQDIQQAMTVASRQRQSSGIISRLFSYIGGIFIFAGIGVFVSMYWDDFNSPARVIVTLGVGFAVFVMGLACLNDPKHERAATPLFLIAAALQPTGILVMLNEYATGNDGRHGVLFMAGYMLIQQGLTFWAKRRTALAFATILFGTLFFATLFDIWGFRDNLIGTVTGFSLLCIAYALQQSRHLAIAPFWYFVGAVALLYAVFDIVEDTPLEVAYLGLTALMIFLSTYVRSRTLLLVSTLAMLGYIGYFTAQHFADTIGWPISLVIIGIALFGLGSLAVRLNSKYIRQPG